MIVQDRLAFLAVSKSDAARGEDQKAGTGNKDELRKALRSIQYRT
eukprot:CAMPEP_0180337746 /NCGR_PEP_ID=MMETSP0988-20121125/45551_1 /TAXON_ID=697907 /ORGANISM="non described non described, Strain CCMP2293" /LENGTH=44 /DNA_ID= /DNA_START= /DNA_END= /DNA_ORIENTATION=